jgi:hypothetical protein
VRFQSQYSYSSGLELPVVEILQSARWSIVGLDVNTVTLEYTRL